jgi:ATP-binding cassette, subfamily B, bacterial PglK
MIIKRLFNKLAAIITLPEKKRLVLLGVGVILLSMLETVNIAIMIPLVNLLMDPQAISSKPVIGWIYNKCGSPDAFLFIVFLSAGVVSVFLFRSIYSVWIIYQQQKITGDISNRLTAKVLRSYLNKPYAYHLINNSSELFKNISSEAMNVGSYLLNPIITIASELIILLGICIFLFYAYPILMLIIFVIFVLISLLVNFVLRKRIRAYASQREFFNAMMYKNALESLGAVKEIQIYGAQDYFTSKYFESNKKYISSVVKFTTISNLPRYIFELAFIVLVFLIMLFGVYSQKPFTEIVPVMAVFGVVMLRLLPAFSKAHSNLGYLHYGVNSLDIVYKVLNENCAEKSTHYSSGSFIQDTINADHSIRLENVTFQYETAACPIFEHFNISLPLRCISAIAGETGSGKSTLIDMVTGLLTPQIGHLYYRDLQINPTNISQYRDKIGYVPQNIFLVDDTIAVNVAFGFSQNEVNRERVKYALEIAQLGLFVDTLPMGIDTNVGEKGVRISGGQRQRIGIARAIYRNPEVLILDEASSALDGGTESELYSALKGLLDKITIIYITHRFATLENADLIYVLEHGKVADSGNYSELIYRSQIFKRMASGKSLSKEYLG